MGARATWARRPPLAGARQLERSHEGGTRGSPGLCVATESGRVRKAFTRSLDHLGFCEKSALMRGENINCSVTSVSSLEVNRRFFGAFCR